MMNRLLSCLKKLAIASTGMAQDMKKEISNWLDSIIKEEHVPESIIVLNIGIYEAEEGYCLYLTGHEEYDEDNDSWAEESAYESPKYCHVHVDMEWKDFLENTVSILKEYFSITKASKGLFDGKKVTTGFDDGDLVRIV